MHIAKKQIQEKFYDKTGLILNIPKHGSGTSNMGNTARRFFRDSELISEITGVNKDLIYKFIILQAMASQEAIDTNKFEDCLKTETLNFKLI